MPRYVSKPAKLNFDHEWPLDIIQSVEVFESENGDTGLLDKYGNPIYRRMDEIGFFKKKS